MGLEFRVYSRVTQHYATADETITDLLEIKGIDYPGWVKVTFRSIPKPCPRENENLTMPSEPSQDAQRKSLPNNFPPTPHI